MIRQRCIFNDRFNVRFYLELNIEGETIYSETYDYYPNNVLERIIKSTGETIEFDINGKRKKITIFVQPGRYREPIELQEEIIWEI